MQVKAIIFDFDGTLADSFETLLGIFEEVTARPQKLTPQEIKNLRGKTIKEIIKDLRIKKWQIPRLILAAKRRLAFKASGIRTFPGMAQTLKQLQADGHQMFILSTNSAPIIQQFLEHNSLEGYFTKIYGDIGLLGKSSALRKVIKKEKISAGDSSYIGDEVRDIEAARKVGLRSVAVAWGFNYPQALAAAKPDFLAKSPKELADYLTS